MQHKMLPSWTCIWNTAIVHYKYTTVEKKWVAVEEQELCFSVRCSQWDFKVKETPITQYLSYTPDCISEEVRNWVITVLAEKTIKISVFCM